MAKYPAFMALANRCCFVRDENEAEYIIGKMGPGRFMHPPTAAAHWLWDNREAIMAGDIVPVMTHEQVRNTF